MNEQTELLQDNADDTAQLLANATEEDLPRHRWPRQLADLVDVTAAVFKRRGRSSEEAVDEAREVVLALAVYFGGRPVYLPKGAVLESALLHAKIWHSFNGRNVEELADNHNLTVRQIQKVLKQQMKYRRGLRQRSLAFPEGES